MLRKMDWMGQSQLLWMIWLITLFLALWQGGTTNGAMDDLARPTKAPWIIGGPAIA